MAWFNFNHQLETGLWFLLMGFAKPAMPQGTSHDIYSVSAQIFFQKNALFGQFLASEASKKVWILDFGDFGLWGFWILAFGILGILDFGFWGFGGFWILGILDFGFWGFWILGILDFGILGILDFGFWGFGGFWILGFWGGPGDVPLGDGAWRSEARIPPGLPLGATSKPTVSNRVGARKQIEHFFRGQNPTKSQKNPDFQPRGQNFTKSQKILDFQPTSKQI